MTTAVPPPAAAPDPALRYKHRLNLFRSAVELWSSRQIVLALAERQIRARYKQALLGFAWALISPLALLVAITVLFNRVADIDTGGVPSSLFNYVGLIPWTLLSVSMSGATTSILNNLALIQKINCPREVFPLSVVAMALFDITLSLGALGVLFLIEGFAPAGTSIWIPVIFVVQMTFVVGLSILLSVITVYFRDLRNALPLIVQLGLFVTPVFWGLDLLPDNVRPWFCLYPMAPVIDSYRRTVLFGEAPQWGYLGIGAIGALATLAFGYWLFKKMEVRIADVA